MHALTAVQLVARHLPVTMDHPLDADARTQMAQASLQAGLAFTNAILGATHALSHQVGGLLDAPHGVVNGILLPHVIRYNAAQDPTRFVPLARAVGIEVDGVPADVVAECLAVFVRDLADRVGVPADLRAIGVTEGDLARMSATALEDACMATNPRGLDRADALALFRAAL